MSDELDLQVKLFIYRTVRERGRPPFRSDMATRFQLPLPDVDRSLARLKGRRLLMLAPDSGEIVMAPPFSATPTGFQVQSAGTTYYANCVWDAYGIPAALHQDAVVSASCGCCGDPAELRVTGGRPEPSSWVAHFAVPARHWWDDLTFT